MQSLLVYISKDVSKRLVVKQKTNVRYGLVPKWNDLLFQRSVWHISAFSRLLHKVTTLFLKADLPTKESFTIML